MDGHITARLIEPACTIHYVAKLTKMTACFVLLSNLPTYLSYFSPQVGDLFCVGLHRIILYLSKTTSQGISIVVSATYQHEPRPSQQATGLTLTNRRYGPMHSTIRSCALCSSRSSLSYEETKLSQRHKRRTNTNTYIHTHLVVRAVSMVFRSACTFLLNCASWLARRYGSRTRAATARPPAVKRPPAAQHPA